MPALRAEQRGYWGQEELSVLHGEICGMGWKLKKEWIAFYRISLVSKGHRFSIAKAFNLSFLLL